MATDYIAAIRAKEGDKLDHGVKGMRWGIRNGVGTPTAASAQGPSKAPAGGETSQERYARLTADVKTHGAKALSDEDLKFLSARADAIKKVQSLHGKNPNFVSDAAKKALKNAVNQELTKIAAGVAAAYISGPLVSAAKSAVK